MSQQKEDDKEQTTEMYPVVNIRGLLFPKPFLIREVVENLIDYKAQEGEVYIVTYPKCGTTWTQYLVWEVLHKGAYPPGPNQMMFKHIPFLEFTGIDVIKNLPKPRVMKTHLPFELQPYNPLAKYIYVVRNPYDCCVSYYFHHCLEPGYKELTFDQYFKLFVTGQLGWGDFFDHVLSWYSHRNDSNVLFLTYEDMKKDTRKILLQIAKFLGDQYFDDLQDEEIINNCLKHSDFKLLKEMGMFFGQVKNSSDDNEYVANALKLWGEVDRNNLPSNFVEVPFFRKGNIGDWKNHFSSEQIKIFNCHMLRKLKNTEMANFWKPVEEETSL